MATSSQALLPLLLPLLFLLARSLRADPNAVVSRIAFGSCANQSSPQPVWETVLWFDPRVFIWLGDNVYRDNKRPFWVVGRERMVGPWRNVAWFYPSPEDELRRFYEMAKAKPGNVKLRERAQEKSLVGRRQKAGVYTSYMFGPEGKQVILLDTRYHRDPLLSDGAILGDPQWQWLETDLHGPRSEITSLDLQYKQNILCLVLIKRKVISNLSATTRPLFYVESWARFPRERERLFRLIDSSKRNGVLFISGDVHFGEISR